MARRNKQAELSGESATPEVAEQAEDAANRQRNRNALEDGQFSTDDDGNVVLDQGNRVNENQVTEDANEISVAEATAANMARVAKGEDPVADNVASDDPHSGYGASPEEDVFENQFPADRVKEVPFLTPNAVTAVPSSVETRVDRSPEDEGDA